jgi:hypothetical protein
MSRTWGNILAAARLRANDNTVTYITSDANALILFCSDFQIYKSQVDDRVRELAQTDWATGAWSGTAQYRDATLTTIKRVISMRPAQGSALLVPAGPELAYIEPWEMDLYYAEQPTDVDALAGPGRFTVIDLGTDVNASVGKKRVWIHPMPANVTSFIMRAQVVPANPVISSDVPDLSDPEAEGMTKVLAYRLATRGGKPMPFCQSIYAEVPQDMQAILAFNQEKADVRAASSQVRA